MGNNDDFMMDGYLCEEFDAVDSIPSTSHAVPKRKKEENIPLTSRHRSSPKKKPLGPTTIEVIQIRRLFKMIYYNDILFYI